MVSEFVFRDKKAKEKLGSNISLPASCRERAQLIQDRRRHAEGWRAWETDMGLRRSPKLSWRKSGRSPNPQPWSNWTEARWGSCHKSWNKAVCWVEEPGKCPGRSNVRGG